MHIIGFKSKGHIITEWHRSIHEKYIYIYLNVIRKIWAWEEEGDKN